MAFRIIWSDAANSDLKGIVKYIRKEWSDASAEKFVSIIFQKVETLLDYPHRGIISPKSSRFRKLKIDKHNFVIYEISNDDIMIHSVLSYKMDHISDQRF